MPQATAPKKPHIVLLEDNAADAELAQATLKLHGVECEVTHVGDRQGLEYVLFENEIDLVISDFALPSFDGLTALKLVRARFPEMPFILLSGTIGEERAVECLKAGATDFILKGRTERLGPAVRRALDEAEQQLRRQAAEDSLRKSRSQFQRVIERIFQFVPEALVVFTHSLNPFRHNKAFEDLMEAYAPKLGHSAPDLRELLLGKTRSIILTSDSGEIRIQMNPPGGTYGAQSHSDPEELILEYHVSTIDFEEAHPREEDAHFVVSLRDISKRVRAEGRIREQAALLDEAQDAILVYNLTQLVVFWNKGAERLYGWRSEEVLGKPARKFLKKQDQLPDEDAWQTILKQGEWNGELCQVNKAGAEIIVKSRRKLLRDEHGQPKSVLVINTDITDKLRLQDQFLRVQRMENLGMLSAGIAHDLNNILAPILMGAPLLRNGASDPADLQVIETLENSAQRGAALVRQILAFARGTGGERQEIHLKEAVGEVLSVVQATFSKSIELVENLSPDLWLINANPTKIHQVLLNLCVNARDAMPNGGTLRLNASNCVLDAIPAKYRTAVAGGAHVLIEVSDTGTGMEADVVARIWEPFFTTKLPQAGTGLGLSTARAIVEEHNGWIEVQTQPGQGTTFRIYLPALQTTPEEHAHSTHPFVPPARGELILVADDEGPVRDLVSTILTRQRYRVLSARDGIETVTLFSQHRDEIRVVITDVDMPGMRGAVSSRIIRQFNPSIRILAVSGTASLGHKIPEHAEFADAFLSKPFESERLISTVHRLLHSGPKASE